uniref:Uncharacterized protein n=1 Tax=Ixodes ricinus TaxID=34613 RepID=A0A6B0UBL7_IXORI
MFFASSSSMTGGSLVVASSSSMTGGSLVVAISRAATTDALSTVVRSSEATEFNSSLRTPWSASAHARRYVVALIITCCVYWPSVVLLRSL